MPSVNITRRRLAVTVVVACMAGTLRGQAPGDTASAFTLRTLAGDSISLSDFKGHPVIINFWGTWCPPCLDEMPLLDAAYQAHHDAGLVVLAINGRDQETSTRAVRNFALKLHILFPVLLDEGGKVRKRYVGRALFPSSVFIGADGVVRSIRIGQMTDSTLQLHLREILPAH